MATSTTWFPRALVCALFGAAPAAWSAPMPADLLTNGGFEVDADGNGVPDAWLGGLVGATDPGLAFEGSAFAVVTNGGGDYSYAYVQDTPATAGETYDFSAMVRKGPGSATGALFLKLEFYGGLNKSAPTGQSSQVITSEPTDWTFFTHAAVAPAGTNYVSCTVVVAPAGGGDNVVWLDDATLRDDLAGQSIDVVFDVTDTSHVFEGFGTQLWADQPHGRETLDDLGVKLIRITKDDASWPEMQALRAQTDGLGIQWVYNLWAAPGAFHSNGLLTDVGGFAAHWVQVVASLDGNGCRPHFIDLMNEPDSGGQWSTGITPAQYNLLVQDVRQRLDLAGYADVRIVGPGTSSMSWSDPQGYIAALDADGLAAVDVWATHAWDDGTQCDGGADCLAEVWPNFGTAGADKDATKSVWVTEYATKEFDLQGQTWGNPDNTSGVAAAHSMAYAVRVYENALALLNLGATALFYWHAEDFTKSWGWVEADGDTKPVFDTLAALFPKIPVGASVLAPPPQDHKVYAAGFVAGDRLVLGLVNDGATAYTKNVRVVGADILQILEAPAVLVDHVGIPDVDADTAQVVPQSLTVLPDNSIDVALPANSTLTVVCQLGGTHAGQVPRVGSPPNPKAFQPGVTSGPTLGSVWDPVIDHSAFASDATGDLCLISFAPANLPLAGAGTLLCHPGSALSTIAAPAVGAPFGIPIPDDVGIVGASVCAQGLSLHPLGFAFANALDVTLGTF